MSWFAAVEGTGPLREAAATFLRARGRDPEAIPRGVEVLAWLAREIDRFARRSATPAEEGAFLDGAGALLGVVLADAVAARHVSRDGRHGLLLGTHGTFDPFAAVARALDADPAKPALIAALALAEAEHAGEGPVARMVRAFERALVEGGSARCVVERFERRVWLDDGTEVDLTRPIEATEGEAEQAVDAAARKLAAMLPGGRGAEGLAWSEAAARLLPRLVGPSFEAGAHVFTAPVATGLALALVLAFEGRARFVSRADLARWTRPLDEIVDHAVARLAACSERARVMRLEHASGPWVIARSGDGLDSARALLPGLHDTLARELGPGFVVAVPHRDVLFAAPGDTGSRASLGAKARDEFARAPHAVSPRLYAVVEGRLVDG